MNYCFVFEYKRTREYIFLPHFIDLYSVIASSQYIHKLHMWQFLRVTRIILGSGHYLRQGVRWNSENHSYSKHAPSKMVNYVFGDPWLLRWKRQWVFKLILTKLMDDFLLRVIRYLSPWFSLMVGTLSEALQGGSPAPRSLQNLCFFSLLSKFSLSLLPKLILRAP